MSLPWSEKPLKANPVVNDEVMILDSQDTDPDTKNKRATLLSLPSSGETNDATNVGGGIGVFAQKDGVTFDFKTLFGETDKITLTENTEDIVFTLGSDVVTTDQANTYDAGLRQSFVSSATTAGFNINAQLPSALIPGDIYRTAEELHFIGTSATDFTLVSTNFIQTLTNKTFNLTANTLSGTVVQFNAALTDGTFATLTGTETLTNKTLTTPTIASFTNATHDHSDTSNGEQLLSTTALSDSSNIARLDVLNDFTLGIKSLFFQSESGSPADTGILRLARVDDIAWKNNANNANLLLEVNANDFLTFNSSFIAVTATQGTSGEVLTSNGGGTAPTFQGVFPVSDNVMIIQGNSDFTKQLKFEVDALIGTGVTRTVTPPDSNITLVDTSDGNITNSNLTSGSFTSITGVGTLTIGTWNANTITVSHGGTGATTFTTNGVLFGNGTSAIDSTSVGTNGDVLTSNGAGFAPTFETAPGGLPVPDTTSIVEGSTDDTKLLRFSIDGFTTATTRIITPPDADITLVDTSDGNITNSNLTSGIFGSITGLGTQTQALEMGTNKITGLDTPTISTDATTKAYVDAIAAGLKWKEAATAGTTADITLSNSQTIDAIAVVNPDRVLVKNQTDATENGIYEVVDAGAWTRTTDADTGLELELATIFVEEGTVNAGNAFTCTSTDITIGVTDIDFIQIFNTVLDAGDGLVVSGNIVDVGAGTGITVNPDDVALTIPVVVSSGGTGAITLTDRGVLFGNATSSIGATAVGTVGQVLTSGGTGVDPSFQTPATVPDVKNGSITSIAVGGTVSVVFNTAFSGTPNVVVSFEGDVNITGGEKGMALSVYSISTTGFTVRYDGVDATSPVTNVQWIATDAGDP